MSRRQLLTGTVTFVSVGIARNSPGRFHLTRKVLVSVVLLAVMVTSVLVYMFGGDNWPNHYESARGIPAEKILFDYSSVSALKGNSTIVIEAIVAALNSTYCSNPHLGCLAGDFDFQLNVVSYLKDSGPQTLFVVDAWDGPFLAVGSKYVLFLKNDWTCAPSPPSPPCSLPPTPLSNTFYPTGGAQGKFPVKNDLVYSYKALYPQQYSWIAVDVNGVPLSQFEAEIRSAGGLTPPLITWQSIFWNVVFIAGAGLVTAVAVWLVWKDLRKRPVAEHEDTSLETLTNGRVP